MRSPLVWYPAAWRAASSASAASRRPSLNARTYCSRALRRGSQGHRGRAVTSRSNWMAPSAKLARSPPSSLRTVAVDRGVGRGCLWRRLGWHALLSAPEEGLCRVALVSRYPCKQAPLAKGEALTRHVAALIDFQGQGGKADTLLVVGVYFQSGHEPTAAGQMEDFVVLEDFNLTPEHHTLLEYLGIAPVARCDDCHRGPPLPATGPKVQGTRRRRIDFGLSHRELPALAVDHCEGPSDHLIVRYSFEVTAPRLRTMPPRQPLNCNLEPDALNAKAAGADWSPFDRAMQQCDHDAAWAALSALGEHLLCDAGVCGVARHDRWDPAEPEVPKHTGKCLSRSAGLRALLRLQARLRMGAARPHDAALWTKIRVSLPRARALAPELPFFSNVGPDMLPVVDRLVSAYDAQEAALNKEAWRRRLSQDRLAAQAWVKRRADDTLAWEASCKAAVLPTSGGHPALEVEVQAALWEKVWCPKPRAPATVAAAGRDFDAILQRSATPAAFGGAG